MGVSDRGQMTVELAVALPVLLAVALVVVNAAALFGECAAFDNLFCEAVRVHAVAPAYGQGRQESAALVQRELERQFGADNLGVSVEAEPAAGGHTRFTGTLRFAPTLFGLPFCGEVFGVPLPELTHRVQLVVDCYKPGLLL